MRKPEPAQLLSVISSRLLEQQRFQKPRFAGWYGRSVHFLQGAGTRSVTVCTDVPEKEGERGKM